MDTTPPLLADAFRLLMDLYEHLSEAEFLATKTTAWSEEDIDSARRLTPDLVLMIRGLPDLPVGVALPGGDDDPRIGQGPGAGVRRDRHASE
jgi:hypothetical protein